MPGMEQPLPMTGLLKIFQTQDTVNVIVSPFV